MQFGEFKINKLASVKYIEKSLSKSLFLEDILRRTSQYSLEPYEQDALQPLYELIDSYIKSFTGKKYLLDIFKGDSTRKLWFSPIRKKDVSIGKKNVDLDYLVSFSSVPRWYGALLFVIVYRFKCRQILEIGTFFGISTAYMLAAADLLGKSHLTSIDKWDFPEKYYDFIFSHFQGKNLKLLQADTRNIFPKFLDNNKKYDFIFHDGTHVGVIVLREVKMLIRSLSSNGVLVLDDINYSPDMKRAWNKIIKLEDVIYNVEWGMGRIGIIIKA